MARELPLLVPMGDKVCEYIVILLLVIFLILKMGVLA